MKMDVDGPQKVKFKYLKHLTEIFNLELTFKFDEIKFIGKTGKLNSIAKGATKDQP